MVAGLRHECSFARINCLSLRCLEICKESNMSNSIFGSCFIQATMLRRCFLFVFAGSSLAAHSAQSAENSFAPDLDILTIRLARSDTNGLFSYRFNTNVVLTCPENPATTGPGFSSTPRLLLVAERGKEAVWPANIRWQANPGSDHASLSPLLRFESKGERFEIKPRRHSVWIAWRKAFSS